MLWKELFAEAATLQLGVIGRGIIVVIVVAAIGLDLYFLAEAAQSGQSQAAQAYTWSAAWIAMAVGVVGAMSAGVRGAVSVTSEKERGCWDGVLAVVQKQLRDLGATGADGVIP
jgi:hypothetical protein